MLKYMLAQAALAAAPDCQGADHHRLDFWTGRWEVTQTTTGAVAGHSVIEPVFAGCAIQETFRGVDGFVGGSLSLWDREQGEWVQFGSGSTGARMQFTGQWDGERINLLTLRPRSGKPALLIRMHLQPLAQGRVRQWSQMSTDNGETWRTRYDFTYRPAA